RIESSREEKVLQLEDSIRKMTSLPAPPPAPNPPARLRRRLARSPPLRPPPVPHRGAKGNPAPRRRRQRHSHPPRPHNLTPPTCRDEKGYETRYSADIPPAMWSFTWQW